MPSILLAEVHILTTMENIKLEVSRKFWNENGKWCVAVQLPCEYWECWSESCWDKDVKKAEEKVMKLVKKHIELVREFKRSAEKQEMILSI